MEMENLYTIGGIFSGRMFCVPDYQRGYAWEERHCQDFLEDLGLLSEGQEHFFGLLILHARRKGGAGKVMDQKGRAYRIYDVVDGQQRLTTIVLFLNAMRREMERFEGLRPLASGIRESFIEVRDMNDQPLPKLTLNRDTHRFFYNAVLKRDGSVEGPRIRSHELLDDARDHFDAYLDAKRQELADGYDAWLQAQYRKVTQRLTLVVHTVESDADAGVVFETMNNRGKDLTELEKVKNYLLYLAGKLELPAEHGLEKKINDTWTHIFERLMAADLGDVRNEDQLLRAHWLMAYDYDRRNWRGSRSIKKRFDLRSYRGRHDELLDALSEYLASLREATVAYCDVFNPEHPVAFGQLKSSPSLRQKVGSAGARLARLGSLATFLPLLMAARIRAPRDGEAYLAVVNLCERFAFRVYRWLRRRANTGESRMFRLGHTLFHGGDVEGALDRLRRLVLRYCSDEQFEARFEQEGENWFRWHGLKYFLYEYEQHLADEKGKDVKMPWEMLARKNDTIEHILPRTLDAGGYWARRFTPEEHERYLHDVGNLTLTFDNSALSNKSFPDKKGAPGEDGCYAGSQLLMEQRLARYEDWTPATIEERRERIEAWAMARWHVENPRLPDTGSEKDEVELARRAIARCFIPRGQVQLYNALYGVADDGLTPLELREAMGRKNLGGLLGALGKRVNSTPGLKEQKPGAGFLIGWDRDDGRYYLQERTRKAIEGLAGLHDIVANWSQKEIKVAFRERWQKSRASQRRELGLAGVQ